MNKILIADDEKLIRNAMKSIMKKYGVCSAVSSGKEALQAFFYAEKTSKPFSLIMLDISMGEPSGVDVLREIRKYEAEKDTPAEKRAKIIMVTGNSDADIVKECIKSGCDRYVLKPLSHDIIAKYVNELKT